MKFVVIGNGGHSKVVSDIVLSNGVNEIIGYLDDKFENTKMLGKHFYGPISMAWKITEGFTDLKLIIAIGNNMTRKKIFEKLGLPDEYFTTVIHKSAIVSPRAEIGPGTVIMPNAVINADAKIGRHVIINTGAVIEHDCNVRDFVHISPNATLTGGVQVMEGASIGAGAAVIPNMTVNEWSMIGAGATVISDIPPHWTAVGTPAKVKTKLEVN